MEKSYRVFVSSTFEDLKDERMAVMQALLESDCIPAGMEWFPAASIKQWELIKKVINDSDFYICVIGGRYGSINEETEKSFSQMEFEYAMGNKKRIIAFLPNKPEDIPKRKLDIIPNSDNVDSAKQEKLGAFKKLVQSSGIHVKYWDDPGGLSSQIKSGIYNEIKRAHKNAGWVKYNESYELLGDDGSKLGIAGIFYNDSLSNITEKEFKKAKELRILFTSGPVFFRSYQRKLYSVDTRLILWHN